MVMTSVLHPFSHNNSIIEPRARFLLSLLEDISIDFPSHFIILRLNFINHLIGFILCQIWLYFSN